jgi:hypothetical protein
VTSHISSWCLVARYIGQEADLGDRVSGRVLEIELECLAKVCECVVLAFAEARHIDIEALGYDAGATRLVERGLAMRPGREMVA